MTEQEAKAIARDLTKGYGHKPEVLEAAIAYALRDAFDAGQKAAREHYDV